MRLAQQCLGAWPRPVFGKKNSNLPHVRVPGPPAGGDSLAGAGRHRELIGGEGFRSAIQEHPLPVGTEGWLERPEVQSRGRGCAGKGKGTGLCIQSQRGWGPGRKEILSPKLDRTLTSGTIAGLGRGDADFSKGSPR